MPLSDPLNVGNEPGQGPLRQGGESRTEPDQKDLPSTRSPRSQAQVAATEFCRDLWLGNRQVKARSTMYLPKGAGEEILDYNERLTRSLFFNAFRKTVEGLAGLIFRKDPVLSVSTQIEEHWENIDLRGTHGDVFAREATEEALKVGHMAILVDFPKGRAETAADDERMRPYWLKITKEQIMSWRTDQIDGAEKLTQIVIEMVHWVPDGTYREKQQTSYLIITRVMGGPPLWRIERITDNKEVVVIDEGTYDNQTEIPVAEIKSSGTESMFVSVPPMLDLAYQNIAHYQMWSDYMMGIHKTNVPILWAAGVEAPRDENAGEIAVGPNTFFRFENPQAKLDYTSHDGAALDSTKKALDDLKSDMGTQGLAMLAPQKRVAETAEAKRLDKATSDSALAVTARGVQDGLERALEFHGNYLRSEGGSIEINRDFEGLLMEAPVMQAYATLVGVGFPPRVVLEALQQGGRIPEEADLDQLELEMLANGQAMDDILPRLEQQPASNGSGEMDVERDGDGRIVRIGPMAVERDNGRVRRLRRMS